MNNKRLNIHFKFLSLLLFCFALFLGLLSGDNVAAGQNIGTNAGEIGPAWMVKDINTVTHSSYPNQFTQFGDFLYFFADEGNFTNLWRTDGTTEGTSLVKEEVFFMRSRYNLKLLSAGDYLIFTDIYSGHIWRSDGTTAGTNYFSLASEFGLKISSITSMAVFNDQVFFGLALREGGGYQLWKTDGTVAGTALVKDQPAESGGNIEELTEYNGALYFSGKDEHGRELWWSNGTTLGTARFKDLNPTGDSYPVDLQNVAGNLYFAANTDQHGQEVWVSDGSPNGTFMLKDIYPGTKSGYVKVIYNRFYEPFTAFNDRVYFAADDGTHGTELWSTNGATAGTMMVADVYSGTQSSRPQEFMVTADKLAFLAEDETAGLEWRVVDNGGNVSLLKEIAPGAGSIISRSVIEQDGWIYFTVRDYIDPNNIDHLELWRSDGTESNTKAVEPFLQLAECLDRAATLGGEFVFAAHSTKAGCEPWITDGGENNLIMLADLDIRTMDSDAADFVVWKDKLYFSADDGFHEHGLWRSDGRSSGTQKIKGFASYGAPAAAVDWLYFGAGSDNDFGLWRSDGSTVGTAMVQSFSSTYFGKTIAVANEAFFVARDNNNHRQIWHSNGTAEGTAVLADLYPNSDTNYDDLTTIGSGFFFSANSQDLWHSDGTENGTKLIRANTDPVAISDVNGIALYINKNDRKLWRSDGTNPGTVEVNPDLPDFSTSKYESQAMIDGVVYFSSGNSLWRSDASAGGTWQIVKIANGGDGISYVTAASKQVFFVFDGNQLWYSDGAPGGAWRIDTPVNIERIRAMGALNDLAFFAADDFPGSGEGDFSGEELWRSDGTTDGTYLLQDIYPGVESSYPRDFVSLQKELFFTAYEPLHGKELWAVTEGGNGQQFEIALPIVINGP